jgi:DNA-binding MarR family transcriptional regulator
LSTQTLSPESVELQTWVQWLRTHAAITRELNADLVNAHGLTINDYEVLLHLARAPDRTLKPVELSARVVLTPSGITRLLGGLEQAGLVERVECAADRRVSYARLTPAGHAKLRAASKTHVASVATQFVERFSAEELETLSALLSRLQCGERPENTDCTVD